MFGGFESLLEVLSKYIIFFLTFYMLVIGLQFERELVSLKWSFLVQGIECVY